MVEGEPGKARGECGPFAYAFACPETMLSSISIGRKINGPEWGRVTWASKRTQIRRWRRDLDGALPRDTSLVQIQPEH